MTKNMFDLDDSLMDEMKKDYSEELKKANALCMREQYDKALTIYNKILDDDFENEDAIIGLLKVHSLNFTKYLSSEIDKDIRIIDRMFPNTENEEYIKYISDRNNYLNPKKEIKEESRKKKNTVKNDVKKPVKKEIIDLGSNPYIREGNSVYFGRYTQESDSKLTPIKWDILDEKDDCLLLISHYVIEMAHFDLNTNNYEKSAIREWLNNTFIKKAFTNEQKALLIEVEVDNSLESTLDKYNKYICPNTYDKIFLLSKKEANKYFVSTSTNAYGTAYAKKKGYNDTPWWWLRSPDLRDCATVADSRDIGQNLTTKYECGIRPACWIKLCKQ